MMGGVVRNQHCLSQHCLTLAPGNFREQIGFRIRDEILHSL